MLITDYLVGRCDEQKPLCLVVKDVIPEGCQLGRNELVKKTDRQDLIQEFTQDGLPVEWAIFPDLPADVVELLESGNLKLADKGEVEVVFDCVLTPYPDESEAPVR